VAYVGKYTIHGAHGSIQKFNVLFMSSPTNLKYSVTQTG
jgi:hypothetical protein